MMSCKQGLVNRGHNNFYFVSILFQPIVVGKTKYSDILELVGLFI